MVLNILLGDFESSLLKIAGTNSIAVSPVLDYTFDSSRSGMCMTFSTTLKEIPVFVALSNFNSDETEYVTALFSRSIESARDILCMLLKKDILAGFSRTGHMNFRLSNHKVITISLRNIINDEKYISLYIPFSFFRLFSHNIDVLDSADTVEHEIIEFFKDPRWMLPDLRSFMHTLSKEDLHRLLNQLRKMNLLTPYQLYLVVQGFPELSLKIKSGLSKNIISDIMTIRSSSLKLNISSRDIAGGIYSIEEAVYRIISSSTSLDYSRFLHSISDTIRLFCNMEFLLERDFVSWITEISNSGLLHRTLSLIDNRIVAIAVSHDTDDCMKFISQFVNSRKQNDIYSLMPEDPRAGSVFEARAGIIKMYRELKMKNLRPVAESLEYLLVRFEKNTDYFHLLLSAGWFALSTALKGVKRKITDRVLSELPRGAVFLIEDILCGVANPNIIHDEMQVNKARNICVREILRLYNQGIVRLG